MKGLLGILIFGVSFSVGIASTLLGTGESDTGTDISQVEAVTILKSALRDQNRQHRFCATKGFWIDDKANPSVNNKGDIYLTAFRKGNKINEDDAHSYFQIDYFQKTIALKNIREIHLVQQADRENTLVTNCDPKLTGGNYNYVVFKTDSPDMFSLKIEKHQTETLMRALSVLAPTARF